MATCFIWLLLLIDSLPNVNAYPEYRTQNIRGRPTITAASPFDPSWIEAFTSLGDSFSVGLGTGHSISAATNVFLPAQVFFRFVLIEHRSSWSSIPTATSAQMAILRYINSEPETGFHTAEPGAVRAGPFHCHLSAM